MVGGKWNANVGKERKCVSVLFIPTSPHQHAARILKFALD